MATVTIVIQDLENNQVDIKVVSDPLIVEGEVMSPAQKTAAFIMGTVRSTMKTVDVEERIGNA